MAKMNVGKVWSYLCGAGPLILAMFSWTGCQTARDQDFATLPGFENVVSVTETNMPVAEQKRESEIINAGDVLIVSFADTPPPALSPLDPKVQDDGTVKLYYNEVFKAGGLTTGQLEQEIQNRYVPKYFTRMTVTVVHSRDTRYYFIGGEVKVPGQKPYLGRITVTQAVQAAADFTDWAKKSKVELIHPDGRKEIINCKKALRDPKLDRWVYPNDKIHVPRSWW
jgi:polysaccharide biosynthesis/export protein VpsN